VSLSRYSLPTKTLNGFVIRRRGPLAKMHNLWAPYNSNAPEPNFTKRGCEDMLDIVIIPVVLVPEFLLISAQRPSEDGGVWIFAPKWTFWAAKICRGPIFMGVPPSTNNTTKTSFGKDLMKIRPTVAEQSLRKKKKHRTLKYKTSPSLAASGAV